MKKYVLKKLLFLLPVMLILSFFTFSLTYLSPADPITLRYLRLGVQPNPELVEKEKQALGLNDPFIQQYSRWLTKALQGDLGESYKYKEPVTKTLQKRIPHTIILTVSTVIFTIIISVPLGVLSAMKKNKLTDYFIRFISFLGISMPSFWVGTILMYYFGVHLKVLPVMGSSTWVHLVLPTATLTFWMVSLYIRRIRNGILEEMNKDYLKGGQALGLSKTKMIWTQLLPNALLSVLTTLGVSIGALLGGATVVEIIFEWKGIGNMAIEAFAVKDFPIIQGYVLWMGIIYVVANLFADILCRLVDPRIRLGEER